MALDLLFHPVFHEAKALAGMSDRKVIYRRMRLRSALRRAEGRRVRVAAQLRSRGSVVSKSIQAEGVAGSPSAARPAASADGAGVVRPSSAAPMTPMHPTPIPFVADAREGEGATLQSIPARNRD